jgi:hypothetical protein
MTSDVTKSRRSQVDSLGVARAVRAAVEAVPNVAHVSAGRFARIGTYGRSTVVHGVAISQVEAGVKVDVHIVASSAGKSLLELAESVRHVTRETAIANGVETVREINVIIEDLRDEE